MNTCFARTLFLCLMLLPVAAKADYQNKSFRVYGAAGIQYVNYSERLKNYAGMEVESDFDSLNFVQRSGGYNAVGEHLGFYIRTASTLISREDEEEWLATGHNGPVQLDTAAMNFNGIDVILIRHFKTGFYAGGGMHYQKVAFSRFNWRSSSATEAFADDIESYVLNDPAQVESIQNRIDNSSLVDSAGNPITTLEEYMAAIRFKPEESLDVVFEDASSFSAIVGGGYDSYFIDKKEGLRYVGALYVGTQLYEHVLNSSSEVSIDRTFGGGYDLQGEFGVGYQFNPKIGLMLMLTGNYSYRPEIRERLNSTQTISLPENTFYAYASYLSVSWNFK
ncbi:MAG: hypothetical protein ACPGYX_00915 [Oceanobacter sp.]